jgi:hypothetical protein
MTWYGVVWCTSEWPITDNFSFPCTYQNNKHGQGVSKRMYFYSLFYNYTLEDSAFFKMIQEPAPIDPVLLRLKLSVDNAIMRQLTKEQGVEELDAPRIEMTQSTYPIMADRLQKDSNIVAQLGGYFFVLGPLLGFTILVNEIVREKELRLRQVSTNLV